MATEKAIILITGANQGLGYYAAAQLSATGAYHVLLGSRALSKAEAAIAHMATDPSVTADVSNISPIEIDVDSDASISAAASAIETLHGRLDILLNNAGISRAAGVHSDVEPNADGSGPGLREQYAQLYNTNVFGVAVVTETMLPLLRKSTHPAGKRVVCTGSGTASLALALGAADEEGGLNGKYYRIYRSTKTALNMLVVSYACELGPEGFVVTAANPGYCGTNLNLNKGFKDPREGAAVIVAAVTAGKGLCHGRLVDEGGVVEW